MKRRKMLSKKERIMELRRRRIMLNMEIENAENTIEVVYDGDIEELRTSSEDSGYDLRYKGKEPIEIKSLETVKLPTGLRLEMFPVEPKVFMEAQVRPRSGMSAKGLCVHLGTIDWGYRGEVQVIATNVSPNTIIIEPGMRIAQLVFALVRKPRLKKVEEITNTERGDKGLGSTGVK